MHKRKFPWADGKLHLRWKVVRLGLPDNNRYYVYDLDIESIFGIDAIDIELLFPEAKNIKPYTIEPGTGKVDFGDAGILLEGEFKIKRQSDPLASVSSMIRGYGSQIGFYKDGNCVQAFDYRAFKHIFDMDPGYPV